LKRSSHRSVGDMDDGAERKTAAKDAWRLTYDRFSPAQENLRETLCALGNGYFCTRGAAPESGASRIHYPGTYVAGVYDTLATRVAGRFIFNEDLVNCPNWLPLTFRIGDGEWVHPSTAELLSYFQRLDMRSGVLSTVMRVRDKEGHVTTIKVKRLVHIRDPHSAALRYLIIPENYAGSIVIRSGLDGSVENKGIARYRQLNSKHLKTCSRGAFEKNGIYLSVKTSQSKIKIAQASRLRIFINGKETKMSGRVIMEPEAIYHEFEINASKRVRYEVEKTVEMYTSNYMGVKNPRARAIRAAARGRRFNTLLKSHAKVWKALWKRIDIRVDADQFAQKALRLHAFHLKQTASVHNAKIDAGLPARGLHGEAYRGHIFWDSLFTLPFFDFHSPKTSRALILYRYRRLGAARHYARENGYKGAMFPWQSGSTGKEETQVIHLNPLSGKWGADHSRNQRHVSIAIAYNVWQYWQRSGNRDFMLRYGAELLVSIAQFLASLTRFSRKDGRYHTHGLMGPDEFHEKLPGASKAGLTDNAYTNLLITWVLSKAMGIIDVLPSGQKAKLVKKLKLTREDIQRWDDITRRMNIIFDENGIISQFDGYFGLKELDWSAYREKYGDIHRLDRILKAEGKSPDDYKVAKQADVLQIFYLLSLEEAQTLFERLGYSFNRKMLAKNYDYYLKRTSHGSTLSKVVHCHVAHMIGKYKGSWRWFRELLKSDMYDTQGGTTAEGIHAGVMGASIDIVFRRFAGIDLEEDRVKITPHLPKAWKSASLRFCYRNNWIDLRVTKRDVEISIAAPRSRRKVEIPFEVNGHLRRLASGRTHRLEIGRCPQRTMRKADPGR
jgi:trehalose/maltose hydrolase-like predicted phosphorylase